MPRMSPEERKAELLALSHQLFQERGFEEVTVADILQAAKLSKGGFYHHFSSKNEVLREIIVSEFSGLADRVKETTQRGDPVAALLDIFRYGSAYLEGDAGILAALSTFEAYNLYLDVLEQEIETTVKPALAQVIHEGIAAGVFSEVNASSTAEIIVAVNHYGNRKSILKQWQPEDIKDYNTTALYVLGEYLGITEQIAALAEQMAQGMEGQNGTS